MFRKTLFFHFCIFFILSEIQAEKAIDLLFPPSGFEKGWQLTDSVKLYSGNELFTYMDGGAEVYIEYGFQKIAAGKYKVGEKENLQCEIYQMADSIGAYGSYTFYLSNGVKPINIGTDAVFSDYYLTFWKGQYLVVISSPSPTNGTIDNIKVLANAVSKTIPNSYHKPLLVEKFIKSGIDVMKIKYFMGRNGMNNFYRFVPGNAFASNQIIALSNGDTKTIINVYGTKESAKKALEEALQKISKNPSNKKVESDAIGFRYFDSGNNVIICMLFNNYVIVTISKDASDNSSIAEIVKVLE
jgi:hypothetical protein